MANNFWIIDANSQIYRCYHAKFLDLKAASGEPTKATYLFTRMLLKLLREQSPTHLAIAADAPKDTLLRRNIYPAYKKNRGDVAVTDIAVQVNRCLEICALIGVPVFLAPGYEADDVCATLADCAAGTKTQVTIVTGDKDLMQLVSDNVRLYDARFDKFITRDQVIERFGVPPEQVADVQALAGDATDNVPGCKGIAVKTAAKLIKRYGSAQGVIDNRNKLENRYRLLIDPATIKLTAALVALSRDVPLDMSAGSGLSTRGVDVSRASRVFKQLGFKTFASAM